MTVRIHVGDCRQILSTMEARQFNCCVTSPPYFGLRDYGHAEQIGLEATPDEYVANLVETFRQVRRVLKDDGTVWLNLGDSYAANRGYQVPDGKHVDVGNSRGMKAATLGVKPKDLMGIPWRVAFALQMDGWFLRSDIIWAKPNPMPESVTDRPTRAHEYLFLLAKLERYFYDAKAIAEPATTRDGRRPFGPGVVDERGNGHARGGGTARSSDATTRNKRSVWTIPTQAYREAHFATFPPTLIEPCVLAGCPEGGTVLDPFAGAGTTGLVADRHHRNAVLIELNPEYAQLAERRIAGEAPLLAELQCAT